jgi:hypothetical protein
LASSGTDATGALAKAGAGSVAGAENLRTVFTGFLGAGFSGFSAGSSSAGIEAPAIGWPRITEEILSRVSGLLHRRATIATRETRLKKAHKGLTTALLFRK